MAKSVDEERASASLSFQLSELLQIAPVAQLSLLVTNNFTLNIGTLGSHAVRDTA